MNKGDCRSQVREEKDQSLQQMVKNVGVGTKEWLAGEILFPTL